MKMWVTHTTEKEPTRKEKLEKQCEDLTVAINDEDSMMSRRMLGHLDNRLRQGKTPLGYQNVPLGGVSLIPLVGDEGPRC